MPKKKVVAKTTKSEEKQLIKKNWYYLFGTAGCWFFVDIAFYGNSMFNSTVLQFIGFGPKDTDSDHRQGLISTAIKNLILVSIAFPGFIVSFLLVDRIGRKPLRLFGFAGTAVWTFCSCGGLMMMGFLCRSLPQKERA
ncbi:inorganic phosphate transporter, putative [Entamoeba invadens IP1]|uniref:Inorganic phosphate transporter, putative n=1 Tax=Entamoeba invadens IP1 TaxID=370355 RepID=L7FLU9_ENTIV|nr:inorganic phosphate transporter, putative [Entamoeba invadens IP1]ELP87595.1 inorganic phosphate transporter, putative [Entamoeba invadens IP1]|eukprot:XP_004254366.1 inorganic phosphate transporter, putative [Entamoeba invadens IP1]